MPQNLRLDVQPPVNGGDYRVVKFIGEFDKAGHSEVKEELDGIVDSCIAASLIFDFHGLKFINSEGIGYLMETHAHLVDNGKKLVIVGLNSHVADVFAAIGIKDVVEIHDTVESYVNQA